MPLITAARVEQELPLTYMVNKISSATTPKMAGDTPAIFCG
jgi:hypothetical protein